MKRLSILLLSVIVVSCAREDDITSAKIKKERDEMVYYSVYKTKADYSDYVYVSKTNHIFSKPNPNDTLNKDISGVGKNYIKWWKGQSLSEDYYFIPFVVSPEIINYTDVTFEEYDNLCKEFSSEGQIDSLKLLETMKKRIIDTNPFVEYYKFKFIDEKLCDIVDSSTLHREPNFDKINEMIESGEFFTYEGVERVK